MTIFRHEMKQNSKAVLITSLACAVLIVLVMSVQPHMAARASAVEKMIERFGPMMQAFSLDRLDLGNVLNYYALEAGNIMLLIGGTLASVLGISMLSKEEGRHTAEFLFPHPVSRLSIVMQKWLALILNIIIFTLINVLATYLSFVYLKEAWDMQLFILMQAALLLLYLCLASICFAISAFLSHEATGVGVGIAILMYILNLLINLDIAGDAFKYITPFFFAEPTKVFKNKAIDMYYLRYFLILSLASLVIGGLRYKTKDLKI
ncbi:MAG: ABC transporter permease subunit [Eubacteriales bacterium]|nr:ABC transporter permease subunit [Eubacteriales bacterium]